MSTDHQAEMATVPAASGTPTETALLDIWKQILWVSDIGVHENFIDLGGHSLSATRCISRIRLLFDVEVPLDAFFVEPGTCPRSQRRSIGPRRRDVRQTFLFCIQGTGHILPIAAIGRALHARGHRVSCFQNVRARAIVKAAGLEWQSLGTSGDGVTELAASARQGNRGRET